MVTCAPPSVVTSLPSDPKVENSTLDPSFMLDPNTAAIAPGAIGFDPGEKLALLTTPIAFTEGAAPWAIEILRMRKCPSSATKMFPALSTATPAGVTLALVDGPPSPRV